MMENGTVTNSGHTVEEGAGKGRYLLISLAVLLADQWSKWLVEQRLPLYSVEPVIPGFLNFTHVKNPGVAFGFLASLGRESGPWILSLLGLFALSLVGLYFWRLDRSQRLLLTALGLILGGAVGNLVDRMAAGMVTDFIDVYVGTYHWHTFNVADSAITVGIVLIAWDSLRGSKTSEQAEQATEA